jgi:hypothetical protein
LAASAGRSRCRESASCRHARGLDADRPHRTATFCGAAGPPLRESHLVPAPEARSRFRSAIRFPPGALARSYGIGALEVREWRADDADSAVRVHHMRRPGQAISAATGARLAAKNCEASRHRAHVHTGAHTLCDVDARYVTWRGQRVPRPASHRVSSAPGRGTPVAGVPRVMIAIASRPMPGPPPTPRPVPTPPPVPEPVPTPPPFPTPPGPGGPVPTPAPDPSRPPIPDPIPPVPEPDPVVPTPPPPPTPPGPDPTPPSTLD